MPNMKDRDAARVAMVAGTAPPGTTDPMARLPRVQITKRHPSADRNLPAVGSFS
jgi:hypothetical protein